MTLSMNKRRPVIIGPDTPNYPKETDIWVNSTQNKIYRYDGSTWVDITGGTSSAAIIAAVVDGAPAALDTLNELAAALNDDANVISSLLTASSASATYLTKASASTTYLTQAAGLTAASASSTYLTQAAYSSASAGFATTAALNNKLDTSVYSSASANFLRDTFTILKEAVNRESGGLGNDSPFPYANDAGIQYLNGYSLETTKWVYLGPSFLFPSWFGEEIQNDYNIMISEMLGKNLVVTNHAYAGSYLITGGLVKYDGIYLQLNTALGTTVYANFTVSVSEGFDISSTEVSYLDGITSNIQTQLDSKLSTTSASATYLTKASASTTYLTQAAGLTAASASSTYLTQAAYSSASANFATDAELAEKLSIATASSTYLTQVSASALYSLPNQSGNNGKYLTTDGSTTSWGTVTAGGGGTASDDTIFKAQLFFGGSN